ncbi:RluA family pseudouridine synthase [Lacticaseibacillus saniviri]|uniref:Pseudouridine synthase n=1 Tax=Lacticaseibacillus saniviri JCM 17471 = DSM 24301 TaxID=1293598 RepID=A0A0R2N2I2_9LACO|nr:RluA family pseudouridine synthase [Lacticaseibacillus saniviri]KRO18237.1 pseudouridylate synthase, 23S RNA-specific [Lacticaseibacillus saniviri JCM 17471 = DSM 24301]MCG4282889.1 RluA family pseudouridine synthase [Lacticaseibacillus saniviri]
MKFTVTTQTGRIDKVLSQADLDFTRSQLQNWLKADLITVNGAAVKANYKVAPADEIDITVPEPEPLGAVPEDIPLDIVYEDDQVIVVNKPQGMVVHPAPGHATGTLVNGLLFHVDLSAINDVVRPGIVHRIDKDTSGLLMVAKTPEAQQSLSAQLKDKSSIREYYALVHGTFKEDHGRIDAPLGRDPKDRKKQAVVPNGRHAVTNFEVVERFEKFTLIKCILETGRTHQIRVHLAYIKHPVAGDPMYGPKQTLIGKGQFLHAAKLGFVHPTTGKLLIFEAPLPAIFEETLEKLRRGIDTTHKIR